MNLSFLPLEVQLNIINFLAPQDIYNSHNIRHMREISKTMKENIDILLPYFANYAKIRSLLCECSFRTKVLKKRSLLAKIQCYHFYACSKEQIERLKKQKIPYKKIDTLFCSRKKEALPLFSIIDDYEIIKNKPGIQINSGYIIKFYSKTIELSMSDTIRKAVKCHYSFYLQKEIVNRMEKEDGICRKVAASGFIL